MNNRNRIMIIAMMILGILGLIIQIINVFFIKNYCLSWFMFGYATFYLLLTCIMSISELIIFRKETKAYENKIKELRKKAKIKQ